MSNITPPYKLFYNSYSYTPMRGKRGIIVSRYRNFLGGKNMANLTQDEIWAFIPDFPLYSISTHGRVLNNRTSRILSTSTTSFGHVKVKLRPPQGVARTMSVPLLVAKAFLEPPDPRCDNVILLDGNLQNVHVDNLGLRPRWFAWKYTRQLHVEHHQPYHTMPIYCEDTDRWYSSTIECGMEHGLLFRDIFNSAWDPHHHRIYPFGWRFYRPDLERV